MDEDSKLEKKKKGKKKRISQELGIEHIAARRASICPCVFQLKYFCVVLAVICVFVLLLVHGRVFFLPALADAEADCGVFGGAGGSDFSVEAAALASASTWEALDAVARSELYVASAAAGHLGKDLSSCASFFQTEEFQYSPDLRVRGAAATVDIPAGEFCIIGENAGVSLATVKRMLYRSQPQLAQEVATIDAVVQTPADERTLLAVLLMRESHRSSSPLMPYLQALLKGAHEHIPSAWDPASLDGAAKRAALKETGGTTLLQAIDALRKHVMQQYASLLPRALKQLPHLLIHGVEAAELYTIQNFAEVWLSMRSRSFANDAHGVLVPLACLMNHPALGTDSNVELEYDATRRAFVMTAKQPIRRGQELTYSYGAELCAERALLVYGFEQNGMPPCGLDG